MPAREPRDSEPDQPSLELPSLSGWRRRRRARAEAPVAEAPVAEPPVAVPPVAEPPVAEPPVAEAPPAPAPTPVIAPEPEPVATETAQIDVPDEATEPGEPGEPEETEEPRRRAPRVRRPGGLPTVVVVGALVGLAVVGLTWAALQACRQVQGTPSCGTAGYPLLALVLALSVVVGSVLLRLALVPDPVSTSVLGVGLAAVILLLTLVGHLEQPAMVVVVPLISALTFASAHWISRSAAEPDER